MYDGYCSIIFESVSLHEYSSVINASSVQWKELLKIYESGMRSLKRFSVDAPSEEDVEKWLAEGDVQKLEQVMLDGRVHLLIDKKTANLAAEEFLQGIHQYQVILTILVLQFIII